MKKWGGKRGVARTGDYMEKVTRLGWTIVGKQGWVDHV